MHLTTQYEFYKRVLSFDLVVPNFQIFKEDFKRCYNEIKLDVNNEFQDGHVADYIPTLARVDTSLFASAFCSTDGQFCEYGDTTKMFSIQSVSKVVTYCYLYELIGEQVHLYVGEEPSGVVFNAPVFDTKGKPHNPMVNAGAIMVCAVLVKQGKNLQDVLDFYARACNADNILIDDECYTGEKATGFNNFALTYLMLAKGAFPQYENETMTKVKNEEALDLYFKVCSILTNVAQLSRFGAMLANNGVNPSNWERIVKPETVQAIVTIMTTCGMYNGAGKFVKNLGIPSKSGVSGNLLSVVPGIGSLATWSPKLNAEGNTVKGISMVKKIGEVYNNFNLFHKAHSKKDLTWRAYH